MKERRGEPETTDQGNKDFELVPEQPMEIPEDKPLFQCHPSPNTRIRPVDRQRVDGRAVQHVIVPYSPLMYQRFYDFPPEPEYSHVKSATKKAVNKRRSMLVQRTTPIDSLDLSEETDLLFDEQMQSSTQSFPDMRDIRNRPAASWNARRASLQVPIHSEQRAKTE